MWQALHPRTRRFTPPPSRRKGVPRLRVEGLEDRLCPSQYLLVSDTGSDDILRYDGTDGHFIDTFVPTGSGGVNNMEYMVPTADGQDMLVDGSDTQTVLRFSLADGSPNPAPRQDGAGFVRPGAGGLGTPEGIVYDPDGNLLVANTTTAAGNILKDDPVTGAFLGVFLDAGAGGDLSHANDMHIGPDGDLYVTSSKVPYSNSNLLRFDPTTGEPLPSQGHSGANFIDPLPFQDANAFTWGPDGNLYLSVDSGQAYGGIDRFDGMTGAPLPAQGQTGAVFVPIGSGGVGFIDSIVFDADGNLLAADSHGAVQKYDGTTGDSLGAFIPAGSGGLRTASGLFFYDQPTTTGHGSQHHAQAAEALGILSLPPAVLPNPPSAESTATVVQAAPEALPLAPTVAATQAVPGDAWAVSAAHAQALPDVFATAEQPLGNPDLVSLP